MSFNEQDRLREIERLVAQLQRDQSYTPVRDPVAVELGMIAGVADALIMPGASGSVLIGVTAVTVRNATGHPVWKYSTVWMDAGRKFIISSNSANLLWGEWDDLLTKFDSDSYSLQAANKDAFDGTGFTGISPYDPAGLLSDISSSEPWVLFATGEDEPLTVVATSAGGSGGGGGFPWPGPGAGPEPGTATVSICTALVDNAGGVDSSDATIPFTGAAAIIGTAPGPGSADNTFLKAMCDGQKFLIISKNGGGWAAMKADVNIIIATVNSAVNPTTGTGSFDGAIAVEGYAPPTGTGDFDNTTIQLRWEDNEQILAIQRDDGKWQPLKIPRLNLISAKVNQSGGVRPSDSTFGFDDAAALQGTPPTGGTGTANNVPTESLADNQVIHLVQRSDNGEWDLLRGGDAFFVVKGQPSTTITRASSTITCNSPTAVQGRIPVGAITADNDPELKAGTGDTIYFVFDLTAGSTNATRWTTAHEKNHLFRLRGYTDYAAASGEYQVLAHDGDEVIRWLNGTLCNPSP